MLGKNEKIRVLENFYAIDFTLFGKSVTKMKSCCPAIIEDYINTKGALMSIMIEMYNLIGHKATPLHENVTSKVLIKRAKTSARIARENCRKLVVTNKGRRDVKQLVREELSRNSHNNVEDIVREQIRTKAFSLAIDNLLIARTLSESSAIQVKRMNKWEGKIVEDAYKILRDNLVLSAIDILNINEITN